jgi:hypothetical protein
VQLQERVLAAFPASAPGWKLARFHSADVHLAAQSVEAIQEDNYFLVLGDFHPTSNPLAQPMFMEQHPHPTELQRDMDIDLPEPRFILAAPRAFATSVTRRGDGEGSLKDYWLLTNLDSCTDLRHQSLALGELLLVESEGRLLVRTRDGGLTFDPWDVFGQPLTMVAAFHFAPFARWLHTPRVTIDRLVLHRESWCIAASAIPFVEETDEAVRFVAARRWALSQGMPRFLFVKVPGEDKPCYVDFDSPIYVSLLARVLRKARSSADEGARITFTEMLPDPDHAWLPDAEGHRYTSELRVVTVDLEDHCA